MPDAVREQIEDNAAAPKRVTVDGMSTEEQPLQDQIAADRYLDGKDAVGRTKRGLRWNKIAHPGTT